MKNQILHIPFVTALNFKIEMEHNIAFRLENMNVKKMHLDMSWDTALKLTLILPERQQLNVSCDIQLERPKRECCLVLPG